MTGREFEFNEYGVCINPETMVSVRKGHDRLEVFVARDGDGRWGYGMRCWFGTGGARFGARGCEMDDDGTPVSNSSKISSLRWMKAKVAEKIDYFDPAQMSLF